MKRKFVKIMALAVTLVLAGCTDAGSATGSTESDTETGTVVESSQTETVQSQENTESSEETKGQETEPSTASTESGEEKRADDSWKKVYADFLEEQIEAELPYMDEDWKDSWSLGFIYLDSDDIPELVLSSGYEAAGNIICTQIGGKVNYLQTSRLNFYYQERGNLLDNNDGNMGYYYDMIYSIGAEGFELQNSGEYNEVYGENGYTGEMEYLLEGRTVTEEEYQKVIRGRIPARKRTYWSSGCTYSDMLNFLKGEGPKDYKEAYSEFIKKGTSKGHQPVDGFALVEQSNGDPMLLCVGERTFFFCAFEDGLLQVGPDWYFSETEFVLLYPELGMVSNNQYYENNEMSDAHYTMENGSLLVEYATTNCEYDENWEPVLDENGYPIITYLINSVEVSREEFLDFTTGNDEKFKQQLAPSNAEYTFIHYYDRTQMLNQLN